MNLPVDIKSAVAKITLPPLPSFPGRLELDSMIPYLLSFILFSFPIFFLPFLANPFDLPKMVFVFLLALATLILLAFKATLARQFTLIRTFWDVPILAFIIIAGTAAYLTPNRQASLTADPVVFASGALLYFLTIYTATRPEKLLVLIKALLAGGAALSLWSVLAAAASVGTATALPAAATGLTGSMLSQALFLAAILPVAVGLYAKEKTSIARFLLLVLALGLVITFYNLYRNPPILLSQDAGWKIATGSMGQSLGAALFGVGPGNYLDAFTLYKPADFNATPQWNLRFTSGSGFYLYLLTTVGVAGLAAFGWIIYLVAKVARKRLELETTEVLEKGLLVSLGVILVAFLLFPAPGVLIVAFFVILGFLVSYLHLREVPVVAKKQFNFSSNLLLRGLPLALSLALLAGGSYYLGKAVIADYYFARSLAAAAQNLGTQTYNLQIKALAFNPASDAYHLSYSQTNLALADALASTPNLTDQQKQAVVQLVQQAIREGRTAVALAPRRSQNWENLSLIYRNLLNFAQGADQWAVASLNQAIAFDPTSPRLQLDLGGVYFALKDYQSAAQTFSQAVNLKPDLANSHYNLAQALKNLNLTAQALQELQMTASLVCFADAASADCQKINGEINSLAAPAAPATTSAEATPAAKTRATEQPPLATSSAQNKNLPKAQTTPPVKISTPSGEITP